MAAKKRQTRETHCPKCKTKRYTGCKGLNYQCGAVFSDVTGRLRRTPLCHALENRRRMVLGLNRMMERASILDGGYAVIPVSAIRAFLRSVKCGAGALERRGPARIVNKDIAGRIYGFDVINVDYLTGEFEKVFYTDVPVSKDLVVGFLGDDDDQRGNEGHF